MGFDPVLGGAAINAASSVASNIFGNSAIDKQNKYNLDMWNRNNQYNTPKAQMQRYKEAGLNPHLIYGQGNSGNSGSPAPSTAAKSLDLSAVGNAVRTYLELKEKDQDIENKKVINQGNILKNQGQEDINWSHKSKAMIDSYLSGSTKEYGNYGQYITDAVSPGEKRVDKQNALLDIDFEGKTWQIDQAISNMKSQAVERELRASQARISKNSEWLSAKEEQLYNQFGILPKEEAWLQVLKMAVKQSTGKRLQEYAPAQIKSFAEMLKNTFKR